MKVKIKRNLIAILGLLIVSATFNIFLLPNNLVSGGISGLALIFKDLYNIDISLFVFIANILLVILSFIVLGRDATTKTIIGAILSPIFLKITLPLSNIINVKDTEIIIQALFGGVLSGLGYGLVFKQGYTSGGTDILNHVFSKIYKIPISTAIILVDGFIVLLGGLVFGIERMLYAIIILILISIYSNKALIGIGYNKTFYIYTSKPHQVKQYLLNTIKNDVTILKGKGGYTNKDIKVLMSVISSSEYYKAKEGILQIDPNAFISISESYESINNNRTLEKNTI